MGLGLFSKLILSAIRCFVQLGVMAFILEPVLSNENIYFILGYTRLIYYLFIYMILKYDFRILMKKYISSSIIFGSIRLYISSRKKTLSRNVYNCFYIHAFKYRIGYIYWYFFILFELILVNFGNHNLIFFFFFYRNKVFNGSNSFL